VTCKRRKTHAFGVEAFLEMRQPTSASGTSPPPFAAEAASETVTRPDPGLARGKWEAPAWAFWVALAVLAAATTLYVLGRMGILKRRKANATGRGQA
jgi:hypothetical protein